MEYLHTLLVFIEIKRPSPRKKRNNIFVCPSRQAMTLTFMYYHWLYTSCDDHHHQQQYMIKMEFQYKNNSIKMIKSLVNKYIIPSGMHKHTQLSCHKIIYLIWHHLLNICFVCVSVPTAISNKDTEDSHH